MFRLKNVLIFCIFSLLVLPNLGYAQVNSETDPEVLGINHNFSQPIKATTFKAEVIDILRLEERFRTDGSIFTQQDLLLRGLEGDFQNQEITYAGISEVEVANSNLYEVGDRVFVDAYLDEFGQGSFYVVEFVRSGPLYILATIFILMVLLIGRFKGFKALISLGLSFVIIIKFILPQILNGRDPFIISLLGGLSILVLIIYITEGIKRKSHLAILSVLLSLLATLTLSVVFTKLTKLTGLAQEEAIFLIGQGGPEINFQGLLLAGFIIGAIGVLDDIVVGQIEAVERIREANPNLPSKKVFYLAYKVGNTHLGAIINTLFLTYAGAALPLLLLFVLNQDSSLTFARVLNTEIISTEIVRTLVGSMGVIFSMPIATFLAAFSQKNKLT